jgi:sodium pump decarboxylase gamma subunit
MSDLLLALEITALGMGLVFAALILLWGLMTLLTSLTAEKEESPSPQGADLNPAIGDAATERARKAQAAAVAVAIAMAERQVSSAHPLADPPTASVSPWQLGMRTRQMYQKGGSIRQRAR